jgi:UDP-N-acetyl-2-amino-2-deoxyglucuronate dehydrogenase
MKNFVLIGAAGFVAPRHLKAIKDIGGNLLAALDPHDSVGVLDSYFPDCNFFTEFEQFDRYCSKSSTGKIDYVSVCSPNYLHDAHCRFGLRIGSDVICEKPLLLHERHIDELKRIEEQYGKHIYTILQLRLSDKVQELKEDIDAHKPKKVRLTYYTPRGMWYHYSWKVDEIKSGGILFNIGVHLFDLLLYLFGNDYRIIRKKIGRVGALGVIKFPYTEVTYDLSISSSNEPNRSMLYDDKTFSFSDGFKDLHTKSYQSIVDGNGFGLESVRNTIHLIESLK